MIGRLDEERREDSRPVFFRALMRLVQEIMLFKSAVLLLIAFFRSFVYHIALYLSLVDLFIPRMHVFFFDMAGSPMAIAMSLNLL